MSHAMARYTVLSFIGFSMLAPIGCGGDASENPAVINGSAEVNRLQIQDTVIGSGDRADAGNLIAVQYEGWLYDVSQPEFKGAKFDGNIGGDPFVFALSTGAVIRGWDQGLLGMRVGGIRTLIVPSALGYGRQGNGPIPPNTALVFEVELLDVQ